MDTKPGSQPQPQGDLEFMDAVEAEPPTGSGEAVEAEPPAGSPTKRQQMERLSDQMEGCEEADSIRRTELAQQVHSQMQPCPAESESLSDIAILQQYVGDVMADVWPSEQIVVKEGFSPRAMLDLTNHIREACSGMDENVGGRAVISPGILLLMLAKVEQYLRHLGRDIWEQEEHQLLAQFKACDVDNNGLLEPDEFITIMKALQARSNLPASLAVEFAELELADFDGGSVSYLEILLALQPEDTALGGHVRFDLFEQICATVWCNQEALLRAFHTLDPDKTSRADVETLTRALQQLNNTLARGSEKRRPLLPFQIEALVSHIQMNEDSYVDYHAFLDAFQIVDGYVDYHAFLDAFQIVDCVV